MRLRLLAPLIITPLIIAAAPPPQATEGAPPPPDVQAIMDSAPYQSAQWAYRVVPLDGGAPLYSQGESHLMNMGSIGKLYSVGTWLATVGPDWTTKTPVYKVGRDLVLVGKGDLVLGGREASTGTLGYSIPPQPDANGIPGAKPAPGDPLAGLNSLARQVKRSGVTSVDDVNVDDRLFDTWEAHDEVISPIVVNDNLIAIQTSPTKKGERASLRIIPDTKAFRVVNKVATVASSGDLDLSIVPVGGNVLEVRGTIPLGAPPTLNVFHVPDPATYARTLFIEALERAGVSVAANPLAHNSTKGMPAKYASRDQVASFTSPNSTATATLIWMISHNYGANLVTCLIAVHNGSKDCNDGLQAVHDTIAAVGIPETAVWLLDGAGGEMSATTPEAITTWVSWLRAQPWGDQLTSMLPNLGTAGSLKLFQTDTPATGKVQGKTGTYAALEPGTYRILSAGQALAGLMEDSTGKQYAFSIFQSGASYATVEGILQAAKDVADVSAGFQQSLP